MRSMSRQGGWFTALLLAVGALSGAASCGSASAVPDTTANLRYAVGSNPLDTEARRKLARRAHGESRPGEALRELLWVHEREKLSGGDRALLGQLLAERGTARLEVGDPDALRDLELSTRFGGAVSATTMAAAQSLCAVSALRHSSAFRQKEAAACLRALRQDEVFKHWDALPELSLEELERLLDWFADAGAKRRALTVAQAYVDGGGRKPRRLAQWRSLHRWWFGSTRPLLPVDAKLELGPEPRALERFAKALEGAASLPRYLPATELSRDWHVPQWKVALEAIISGYRTDPALADRLAMRFADGAVYRASRAAILCELFYRLKDVERAREWAQHLVDSAPNLPAAQEAAGFAHAVAGEPERAGLFLVAAAAASGDAGATWARAAQVYRLAGQSLAAVDAGRQAVGLTARGWDMHILLEIALAQDELGRGDHAEQTLQALWLRFAPDDRATAKALANAAEKTNGPGRLATVLGPIRHNLGFRAPIAR